MKITIEAVKIDEKEVLRNLLEKDSYEFSQYTDSDVNEFGLYGYKYLDHYWTDENCYPFFIKVDSKLAGFVMINDRHIIKKTKAIYEISEFFIMYKYRRKGIGKFTVKYILDKFKGTWQLIYHPKNKISEEFWINTINEYTKGKYELIKDDIETFKYPDGTIGHIMVFRS
jgi:predicted acetyltransferase